MIELLRTKLEPNTIIYVTAKVCAQTMDGNFGAFGKSECSVYHNGFGVLPVIMLPLFTLQQTHGFDGDLLWMIDDGDLVLVAHNEEKINWQASFDILRPE